MTIDLPGGGGVIPEYRAKQSLALFDIPFPAGGFVTSLDAARAVAARVGYPIVLKAQAAALSRKSDAGGVILAELRQLKKGALLDGFRGSPALDVDAVATIVAASGRSIRLRHATSIAAPAGFSVSERARRSSGSVTRSTSPASTSSAIGDTMLARLTPSAPDRARPRLG